jgi:16S rRNA (adenine1518-N6/adenine1519-N6)-dimethyltransferase
VAATLRALGVRPSRRLGQNFLTDPRVAERIAGLIPDPTEPVVEIGPGLGALTVPLARTGRGLVAVELDHRLADHVGRLLADLPAARVERGDILRERIDALIPGEFQVTVVGNLPYAITSPALAWLLDQGPRVSRAVLMLQREVAERLAAPPGTKRYGPVTVFVRLEAEVRSEFRVSPGAFYPRPEVDSVVLTVTPRAYPGTTGAERARALALSKAAMGTRRKTLQNALAHGMGVSPSGAATRLRAAGIDPRRRGETLTVEELLALARVPGGETPDGGRA